MHGVNWDQMTEAYWKFLSHIDNNYDFAEMLSEWLGELNVRDDRAGLPADAARARAPQSIDNSRTTTRQHSEPLQRPARRALRIKAPSPIPFANANEHEKSARAT